MFLQRLLRGGLARTAGERLYAAAVARARTPALYERLDCPDTPDGRFEIYTLHVLMVLDRLKGRGARAAATAQALFDAYVSGLDHGLRELAVGDLSVGKTMRKLGEAFYGRGKALTAALEALPDRPPLEGLVARTVFGAEACAEAGALADYLLALRADLAAIPTDRLLEGEIDWGDPL